MTNAATRITTMENTRLRMARCPASLRAAALPAIPPRCRRQEGGDAPVDEIAGRVTGGGGQSKHADGQQRRTDCIKRRHAAAEHDCGDDEEPATDPEEP